MMASPDCISSSIKLKDEFCTQNSWAGVTVKKSEVVMEHLPETVTYADIQGFLQESSLDTHSTPTIATNRPLTVILTFKHEYLASAAAAILVHRGKLVFSRHLAVQQSSGPPPVESNTIPVEDELVVISDDEPTEDAHAQALYDSPGHLTVRPSSTSAPQEPPVIVEETIDELMIRSDDDEPPITVEETVDKLMTSSDEESSGDEVGTQPILSERRGASRRSVSTSASSGHHTAESTTSDTRTLSSAEYEPPSSGITIAPLPVAAYSKARRVLVPADSDLPLLTVSMRADINFFSQSTKTRLAARSLPNGSDICRVVDAVMVGNTAVIGYNGKKCQVAALDVCKDKGSLVKIRKMAHALPEREELRHHGFTNTITCITGQRSTDDSVQFFTGGSDKTVRLWTLPRQNYTAATHENLFSFPTIPQGLAYRDGLLWVTSSTRIHSVDLNDTSTVVTSRLSNIIHNILLHQQAPTVRILEVDHLDHQIQIFDERKKSGFSRPPDISFGARCPDGLPNRRHARGDTSLSLYAKGFPDGTVKVWDYRHAKRPMINNSFQRSSKVTHVAFADPSTLLCYSDRELASINLNEAHS